MAAVKPPSTPTLRVSTSAGGPDRKCLASVDHLLVVLPKKVAAATWRKLPSHESLRALTRRAPDRNGVPAVATHLDGKRQVGISIAFLGKGATAFEQLSVMRRLFAAGLRDNVATIALYCPDHPDATALLRAGVAAAHAAHLQLPSFKSKPAPRRRFARLRLLGAPKKTQLGLGRAAAEAEGNNLARWLTSLPPNVLDTAAYRTQVLALADTHGWDAKVFDMKALKRLKAGAFLAVARANAHRDAAIVRLRYRPKGKRRPERPDLCLVGKGICVDTGGVNVKPARYMQHMHGDMQGSAVALGTLVALTRLDYPAAVDCWLAITENCIAGAAYVPQEVVTAVDGTTIEVIHTDAEGRMVLADALALAARDRPRRIVDYATLTGTCMDALTRRYSGVFSNRPELLVELTRAGQASGERVWPFPLDADFEEDLKSDIADTKQCTVAGGGDHILAALFLQRFVPRDAAWVHIDLAAAQHKGGLAHVPSEFTGFGVRYTLGLLLDSKAFA